MAVRSVIDVEINDEAFQRYRALFEKYQEQVVRLPDAWAEIGNATKGVASEFQKVAAALTAHADASTAIVKAQAKSATIGDKQTRQWHSLVDSSKKIAHNFAHVARSMLRISTVTGAIGGLLGVGSLFGIDRLAHNVSSWRRAALGLGTTIGGQRAFGLDFNRVVDSNALLSGVNTALHDVTKRSALMALGLNPDAGADAATVSAQALGRVKGLVDQTPDQLLGSLLQSRRLGDLGLSLQDLERIKATPAGEIAQDQAAFTRDRRSLELQGRTAKAWQDLQVQLSRAGQQIETTFIMGLTPLAPELAKLSDGFTGLVKAFLSNPHLKEWIDEIAVGMDHLAGYLKSDRLGKDVNSFMDSLETLVRGIGRAVTWLEHHIPFTEPNAPPGTLHGGKQNDGRPSSWFTREFPWLIPGSGGESGLAPGTTGHLLIHRGAATSGFGRAILPTWLGGNDEVAVPGVKQSVLDQWGATAKYIARTQALALEDAEAAKQGVPAGFARAIFKQEGGLNPDGSPRVNPKSGAIGAGQLMPGTAIGLHVNPADTAQNIHGSVQYMHQMLDLFHGNQREAAAAYNWGPGNVQRALRDYGADWLSHAPAETQAYAGRFPSAGDEVRKYAGPAATPAAASTEPMTREDQNHRALTAAINRLRTSRQAGAQVSVNINNATGANVSVSGAQLAVAQ